MRLHWGNQNIAASTTVEANGGRRKKWIKEMF